MYTVKNLGLFLNENSLSIISIVIDSDADILSFWDLSGGLLVATLYNVCIMYIMRLHLIENFIRLENKSCPLFPENCCLILQIRFISSLENLFIISTSLLLPFHVQSFC